MALIGGRSREFLAISRVSKPRTQPPFGLGKVDPLALCIVLDLVLLKVGNREVMAVRMGEIQPANRSPRVHGAAFGERNAGRGGGIEQTEQQRLLGVVRLRGVSRRG